MSINHSHDTTLLKYFTRLVNIFFSSKSKQNELPLTALPCRRQPIVFSGDRFPKGSLNVNNSHRIHDGLNANFIWSVDVLLGKNTATVSTLKHSTSRLIYVQDIHIYLPVTNSIITSVGCSSTSSSTAVCMCAYDGTK